MKLKTTKHYYGHPMEKKKKTNFLATPIVHLKMLKNAFSGTEGSSLYKKYFVMNYFLLAC